MTLESIRIRELEASLEAHRLLLSSLSARAEAARAQLLRIGREVCGEALDRFLAASGSMELVTAEELGAHVMQALGVASAHHPEDLGKQIREKNHEIAALKDELNKQTRRADQAEQALSDSMEQVKVLEKNFLEASKKYKELSDQVSFANQPPSDAPDYSAWFETWSKRAAFERDRTILTFLGSCGLAMQKEIVDQLLQSSRLKTATIYTGIKECEGAGLLERHTGPSSGGHPTNLINLTPKGQWIYVHITHAQPVPSDYEVLLKAHKSNKHIWLIYRTADHFARLGYETPREPLRIKLEGRHVFEPDLVVRKDGDTYYLEIETGEKIDRPSLEQKWENAMAAGGGRICVVTPHKGAMTTIQSNIVNWANRNGKRVQLFLTNLDALSNCQPGDTPWVRKR